MVIKTSDPTRYLEKLLKELPQRVAAARNADLIADFIRDARLGKTVLKGSKKKIGTNACYKYAYILTRLDAYWKKPFDEVTPRDMENYIGDLEDDKLLSVKGTPFTAESKHDYKKTVRKFFKWLHKADFPDGHADKYARLTHWIDSTVPQAEVEALSREQVQRMADCAKLRDKVIIWILFDSGARAEEFLNLRVADLERKDTFYFLRIRHETSKTVGRTIDLTMKETVDLLDLWLKNHPARRSGEIDPEARIVPVSYSQLRKQLSNLGRRILNKRITPHTMRHSSATYWAGKCVPYQLCYRFGWSMRSDMPTRYIDRAGVAAKQTAQIERADRLSDLSRENDELKEEMSRIKAQMEGFDHLKEAVKKLQGIDTEQIRQQMGIVRQTFLDMGEMALQGKLQVGKPSREQKAELVRAMDVLKKSMPS